MGSPARAITAIAAVGQAGHRPRAAARAVRVLPRPHRMGQQAPRGGPATSDGLNPLIGLTSRRPSGQQRLKIGGGATSSRVGRQGRQGLLQPVHPLAQFGPSIAKTVSPAAGAGPARLPRKTPSSATGPPLTPGPDGAQLRRWVTGSKESHLDQSGRAQGASRQTGHRCCCLTAAEQRLGARLTSRQGRQTETGRAARWNLSQPPGGQAGWQP